jgi:hypothetical protein
LPHPLLGNSGPPAMTWAAKATIAARASSETSIRDSLRRDLFTLAHALRRRLPESSTGLRQFRRARGQKHQPGPRNPPPGTGTAGTGGETLRRRPPLAEGGAGRRHCSARSPRAGPAATRRLTSRTRTRSASTKLAGLTEVVVRPAMSRVSTSRTHRSGSDSWRSCRSEPACN